MFNGLFKGQKSQQTGSKGSNSKSSVKPTIGKPSNKKSSQPSSSHKDRPSQASSSNHNKSKTSKGDRPHQTVTPQQSNSSKRPKLTHDLSGSRFRWLNDMLYSQSGNASFKAFSQDPHLFDQYHAGFASQAEHWPTNPVDQCITWLRKNEKIRKIGDFGCGEAAIAQSLKPEGRIVHSFDLVANGNPNITACNISNVPVDDESLDAAVFNLSLMGTDWPSFIEEARRCLRAGGLLYVAEVTSRLQQPEPFAEALEKAGFEVLRHQPSQGNFFHTFVARKDKSFRGEPLRMDSQLLGKCHYKKR